MVYNNSNHPASPSERAGERLEIAIITPDTLSAIGLRELLKGIDPICIVRMFPNFGAFADDTPDMYTWYFVSSQTYVLYNAFFLPRKEKTIILMHGVGGTVIPAGNHILNIFLPEQKMQTELARFFEEKKPLPTPEEEKELSAREIEVLVLVSKGYINKEIADKLNISLTTVITHRKNITEKLGIKSVSGLTMYAVMNGYVEADRI
ncbi:response regulator transcription factor [Bacteroides sp. 224]|uniref:response regulator transcription factor n=1 Tax=Bacteroides sp. 224 TaxID=2302936 RepID=UPI0013D7D640|nr:LuxR C-terminal-related transcriptional regulator [Bacteroides sp. 224]NDV64088.1 DNA-binding response regulator [Bacteroides sp. 224]